MADLDRQLAEAVRRGGLKPVVAALNAGADPNATYNYTRDLPAETTVLMMAIAKKVNPEISEVLITNGADVNATNENGTTALHYAVAHNNVEGMRQLIAAKANLNIKGGYGGGTPLHAASFGFSHLPVLPLLLEAGADTEVKNDRGQTVFTSTLEGYLQMMASGLGIAYFGGPANPVTVQPVLDILRLLIEAGATVTPEQMKQLPPDLQRLASAKKRSPLMALRQDLLERMEGGRRSKTSRRKTKRRHRKARATHKQ